MRQILKYRVYSKTEPRERNGVNGHCMPYKNPPQLVSSSAFVYLHSAAVIQWSNY